MRLYALLLLVILTHSAFSQYPLQPEELFNYAILFPQEEIKQKEILTIHATVIDKKKNDILRETVANKTFSFNELGQLIQLKEVELAKGMSDKPIDTVITQWRYNRKGSIVAVEITNKYGFFSTHYTYNDDNQLTEKIKRDYYGKHQEIDLMKPSSEFKERFAYQFFDNQIKMVLINSEGQPYAEKITYFDNDQVVTKEYFKLYRSNQGITSHYIHDNKGRLIEINYRSEIGNVQNKSIRLTYNELGKVEAAFLYINGEEQKEYQVIYDESGFLVYFLTREAINDFITVLKLNNIQS